MKQDTNKASDKPHLRNRWSKDYFLNLVVQVLSGNQRGNTFLKTDFL